MVNKLNLVPVVCRLKAASVSDLAVIEAESNRIPWNEELFRREFANKYSAVFGIRARGCVAGFLVVHTVLDEAHIVNLGVRRALRGCGLGRTLLSGVLEWLRSQGVRTVTLEARRSNIVALNLYSSTGFFESGERGGYYSDNKEDAICMTLDLSGPCSEQRADICFPVKPTGTE